MAVGSDGLIKKVFKEVKRVIKNLNREAKKVGKNLKKVVFKPFKTVVKVLGPKKVKISERYKKFIQTASRIIQVSQEEYRVEEITPCPHGKHDIRRVDTPVQISFADGVTKMQDLYCTKCGQHFYTDRHGDEL